MTNTSKHKAATLGGLAVAMGAGAMLLLGGVANAANHREAPITALDKIADVTDWYTFRSYDGSVAGDRVTIMSGHDGLSEPSNGPNFFPFHNEIRYDFNVDNNENGRDDLQIQFFFSELDTNNGIFGNNEMRFPENFTGFAGIASNVCIAIPNSPAGNQVCETPNPITGGQGRLAPINDPDPHWDLHAGYVIPEPIAPGDFGNQAGFDSNSGVGLPQTYKVRIVRFNDATGGIIGTHNIAGRFPVVPANMGPRTMEDYVQLSRNGVKTFALPAALGGGNARVFAGTTDDPFPVALGQSFDTINYSLVCGGGVNIPTVEAAQAGNCQPNEVDGYVVNTIAIDLPVTAVRSNRDGVGAGSPVIGTYGTTLRPRNKIFSPIPGAPPQFVRTNGSRTTEIISLGAGRSNFTQIARMGNPLFNEVIVGTGCKDIFSQQEADTDGVLNNCRGTGHNSVDQSRGLATRYLEVTDFVLDPYLPRLVNALVTTDASQLPLPPLPPLLPVGRVGALEAPDSPRQDMRVFFNYTQFKQALCNIGASGDAGCTPGTITGPADGGNGAAGDIGADLLRLDTRVDPVGELLQRRMGPLDNSTLLINSKFPGSLDAIDPAGWPNGRRVLDDVIDGVVRVEMGVLNVPFMNALPSAVGAAPHEVNLLIGDASQGNDLFFIANAFTGTNTMGYQNRFPYVAPSHSGSNSRHVDTTEVGCILAPGGICPPPSGGGV